MGPEVPETEKPETVIPSIPLEPSQPLPTLPGGELPDIGVDDPIIAGEFSLDGKLVFGSSVLCNGEPANAFEFSQKETVICQTDDLSWRRLPMCLITKV